MNNNLAEICQEDLPYIIDAPWLGKKHSLTEIWVTVIDWNTRNRNLIFRIAYRNGFSSDNQVSDTDIFQESLIVSFDVLKKLVKNGRIDLFIPAFAKAWGIHVRQHIYLAHGYCDIEIVHASRCDIEDHTQVWKYTERRIEELQEDEDTFLQKIQQLKNLYPHVTRIQAKALDTAISGHGSYNYKTLRNGIRKLSSMCAKAMFAVSVLMLSHVELSHADTKIYEIFQQDYSYEKTPNVEFLEKKPMQVIAQREKPYQLAPPHMDRNIFNIISKQATRKTLPVDNEEGRQDKSSTPTRKPNLPTAPHPAESLNEIPCEKTTVYFDFDKDFLSKPQAEILEQKIRNCESSLSVAGYTCDIGPRSYNQSLSVRRANSVAEQLEGQGKNVSSIVGFGENDLVSSDPTKRYLSRRVEITPKDGE